MTTLKINKRFVDAATSDGKQQTIYWDSELKGFGLRVTPTRKTYVAQSRVAGKTVRITIGLHGPLTPEQARNEAKRRLGEMATGININSVARNAKLKGVTLVEAYQEYIKSRTLTENTLKDYAKAMRLGFPDWHNKPIQGISRDLIENRFNALSKKSLAQANQIFRFLRALLNFAKEKYTSEDGEPLIPSNPCDRLTTLKKWHRINRRTNYLETNQLKPWFEALHIYAESGNDTIKDYCTFILLTGCREQEAARLKWEDVDLCNQTVTFQQTKNHKIHVLPCGKWLTQILTIRKSNATSSSYVFPANNKYGHLKYHRKNIAAISERSGIGFTLHDLRRTFASIVNHQLGRSFSMYTIKKLLNHSDGDVTSGYIQCGIDDLREPMQLIENFVLHNIGLHTEKPCYARITKMADELI